MALEFKVTGDAAPLGKVVPYRQYREAAEETSPFGGFRSAPNSTSGTDFVFFDSGNCSTPVLGDLDGDGGDPDLVTGDGFGILTYSFERRHCLRSDVHSTNRTRQLILDSGLEKWMAGFLEKNAKERIV